MKIGRDGGELWLAKACVFAFVFDLAGLSGDVATITMIYICHVFTTICIVAEEVGGGVGEFRGDSVDSCLVISVGCWAHKVP